VLIRSTCHAPYEDAENQVRQIADNLSTCVMSISKSELGGGGNGSDFELSVEMCPDGGAALKEVERGCG